MKRFSCEKCGGILLKGSIECGKCGYVNEQLYPVIVRARRLKKEVIVAVVCVLAFGLGIALIAYLKSNTRVKNIFANNIQTLDCYADYLIGISENYPDDTEFIIYGSSYGYKDNFKIEKLDSGDEIPWEASDRPNPEQEKAINRIFRLCGSGALSMMKTSEGCIISIVFNGNSDNWKEIVYSTNPDRIVSIEFVNYSIQESYKYSHEELAENWVFWYTDGKNQSFR